MVGDCVVGDCVVGDCVVGDCKHLNLPFLYGMWLIVHKDVSIYGGSIKDCREATELQHYEYLNIYTTGGTTLCIL